jgi:hypothetical protein
MPSQLDTVEVNAGMKSAFEIEEVHLQFQLKSTICTLLVRNNYVYLILKSGLIYQINLDSPEHVSTIQIKLKANVEILNAWLDSNRYHLIIRSSKNEYYYVNHTSNTYLTLSKLKNLNINSILFFEHCMTKYYTGPLLISTSNSLILEYVIDNNKETLLKTVINNKYNIKYVTNTLLSKVPNLLTYSINIFTFDNKLLTFKSKIPTEPSPNVSCLQSLGSSYPSTTSTENVLNISTIDQTIGYIIKTSTSDYALKLFNLSKYSKISTLLLKDKIKSFILTGYYILLLTADNKVKIYNQIDLQLVETLSLNSIDPKLKGFSYDSISRTFWLYADNHIYELIVDFENSGIIKTMLENNMYDNAISLISPKNKQKYNYILKKKAYHLLEKHEYKNAVDVFLQTDEPFDKVALEIFNVTDKSILRRYLSAKLESFSNSFKAQKTLLSSWIVESYVEELNSMENKLININTDKLNSMLENGKKKNENELNYEFKELQTKFHGFLSKNINNFDKQTIYQIITSHNRSDDLLYFANLVKDFHFVLKYYITLQKWDEALKVLTLQQNPTLVYQASSVLLVNHPVKTVDVWIRLIDDLDPLKLMTALLTYNRTVAFPNTINPENNQALRLLKFLIYEKQIQNKLIHNTFFSTLITYPNIENENMILKHLELYQTGRKRYFGNFDKVEVSFDYDFILRLCFKFNKIQSAIYLYSTMGKNEEAVNLALKNDLIESAILVADKPTGFEDNERKHLWLRISKKLINKVIVDRQFITQNKDLFFKNIDVDVEENEQIYILLQYLTKKCDLITIKDLLPLFPDFIVIDNFKDSLVESLQKLSLEMTKKSIEMDSTLKESENLNLQIKNFEAKNFQIINPSESCEICHSILTIRKFIVFPCSHAFHQDCLVQQILESNNYKTKNSIYKLQKQIIMNSKNPKVLNVLKDDIAELLSKSCCLCSEIKINEIDDPLIKAGDKEKNEWEM